MATLDLWRGENRPSNVWDLMTRDFDRMMSDMGRFMPSRLPSDMKEFLPACDIEETDSEYHLTMDIPGIRKDDISIEVSGNELQISGERKREQEEGVAGNRRFERQVGQFFRSFTLPANSNPEKIEASYDHGVLRLAIPKDQSSKAKRISIKEAGGK